MSAPDDLTALIAENARLKELVAAIVPWPGDVPLCGEQTPKIDQILDLIKYLVTVHARWGNTAVQFRVTWGGSALWAADELRKEISQLTTQRDELAKALEPFAKVAKFLDGIDFAGKGRRPDWHALTPVAEDLSMYPDVGDCRRAAEVLAKIHST